MCVFSSPVFIMYIYVCVCICTYVACTFISMRFEKSEFSSVTLIFINALDLQATETNKIRLHVDLSIN